MSLRDYTKETLRGLVGVLVIVENIKQDAEEAGLTIPQLQLAVEQQLAQGGVRVLEHDEWRTAEGRPWLYVSINTVKVVTSYFFSIDVQLKQEVALRRDASIMTSSATWEMGSIGFVTAEEISSKIPEFVSVYVADFISDYIVANSDA